MINVAFNPSGAAVAVSTLYSDIAYLDPENRNDWRTLERATEVAEAVTEFTGELYIPVDRGAYTSPRFDVIRAPKVGDKVSYAFNGDSRPCGEIVKISPTMKKITTSDGKEFYRRGQSASWINNGTWSMIQGHHNERNPSF